MKILVSQDWENTVENHAGVSYQCKKMTLLYPDIFTHISVPRAEPVSCFLFLGRFISSRINWMIRRHNQNKIIYSTITEIEKIVHKGDELFLMEYFDVSLDYLTVAKIIRKKHPDMIIYGLSHLVPEKLDKSYSDNRLMEWKAPINYILTLGHSLTDYYVSRGFNRNEIKTTFDPVDDYYIENDTKLNETFTVIVMGNQMRDEKTLLRVVEHNQDVKFKICQGMRDFSKIFTTKNVELIPFVEEDVLREHMLSSDVSLNIMKDTIGSTVIVTSIGMGLAMICTDVGSIHDYCNNDNTIFCNNLDDYSEAIKKLKNDKELLLRMKRASIKKAKELTTKVYCDLIIKMT